MAIPATDFGMVVLTATTSVVASEVEVSPSMSWVGPILSVVSFVAMAGMTYGILRTTVKDIVDRLMKVEALNLSELKTKHESLASELRPTVERLNEHVSTLALSNAAKDKEIAQLQAALSLKASKESVESIQTQLSEIKGMLNAILLKDK